MTPEILLQQDPKVNSNPLAVCFYDGFFKLFTVKYDYTTFPKRDNPLITFKEVDKHSSYASSKQAEFVFNQIAGINHRLDGFKLKEKIRNAEFLFNKKAKSKRLNEI